MKLHTLNERSGLASRVEARLPRLKADTVLVCPPHGSGFQMRSELLTRARGSRVQHQNNLYSTNKAAIVLGQSQVPRADERSKGTPFHETFSGVMVKRLSGLEWKCGAQLEYGALIIQHSL